MATVDQLRAFRVLLGFSLQQLAALELASDQRKAAVGDMIFAEGEDAQEMIFLLDGKMEVSSRGNHIADIKPGHLVGEMGVLRSEPRIASLKAVESSLYLALSREEFHRLAATDPDLGMKFYQNLCAVLMEQLKKNNLELEFFQALSK